MKEIGSHGLIFGPEIQKRSNELKHQMYSNMFIYWWYSNSNTLFLTWNNQTLNFEPNRFTKLLIKLNQTSFFRTSNEPKHVLLVIIELEHPNFGFVRSNIELRTSLQIPLKFPSDRYLKPRS